MPNPCVMVVDDEPLARRLMGDILKDEGARVLLASDGDEGLRMLAGEQVDVLFTDLRMPGRDGISVLHEARRIRPQIRGVLLTGYASLESSVEALRLGAVDYVTKPITAKKVAFALARATADRPKQPTDGVTQGAAMFDNSLVAVSTAMRRVIALADSTAANDVPVLIDGEPGVGKLTVAQRIHRRSARAGRPLVRVPCHALAPEGLEQHLFGDMLSNGRPAGLASQADRGTLLLHHVTALPMWAQSRLLEMIQRHWRGGQAGQKRPEVRLIAIVGGQADQAVARGELLRPLYDELNVAAIHVPPLRSRPEDIPALAEHFARRFCIPAREADALAGQMAKYEWPGNVSELAAMIRRNGGMGDVLISPTPITVASPQAVAESSPSADTIRVPIAGGLKEIERRVIREVIDRCQGNKAAAARQLGLHRKTLYRMLANQRATQ